MFQNVGNFKIAYCDESESMSLSGKLASFARFLLATQPLYQLLKCFPVVLVVLPMFQVLFELGTHANAPSRYLFTTER